MTNLFSTNSIHQVTEANINFYEQPFVHPKRNFQEHVFIYLVHGEWKIGQNDETFELKKDTLLILKAGNTHYGVSPCTAGTKTMYFHIAHTADTSSAEKLSVDTLINAANNKNIKKFFHEIINCKRQGNQRKANLYFELLLCELAENKTYNESTDIAAKIKNIIHRYPEKFFSNKEVAQMLNVSVKTAETKFKAAIGKTIHQYMLEFKVGEAISYFEMFPELSIKETAYNLGFYDEYHFSRQFKRYTGISPSEYKKSKIRSAAEEKNQESL